MGRVGRTAALAGGLLPGFVGGLRGRLGIRGRLSPGPGRRRALSQRAGPVPGTPARVCAGRRIPSGSASSTCRWSCRTSWHRPSRARTVRRPPRHRRSNRTWPCSVRAASHPVAGHPAFPSRGVARRCVGVRDGRTYCFCQPILSGVTTRRRWRHSRPGPPPRSRLSRHLCRSPRGAPGSPAGRWRVPSPTPIRPARRIRGGIPRAPRRGRPSCDPGRARSREPLVGGLDRQEAR